MSGHGSGSPTPTRRTFTPARPICRRQIGARPPFTRCCLRFGLLRRRQMSPVPARRGSGVPLPRRRTFATALRACAHCMSAALRHPCLRLLPSPGDMAGAPPPASCFDQRCGRPPACATVALVATMAAPASPPAAGCLSALPRPRAANCVAGVRPRVQTVALVATPAAPAPLHAAGCLSALPRPRAANCVAGVRPRVQTVALVATPAAPAPPHAAAFGRAACCASGEHARLEAGRLGAANLGFAPPSASLRGPWMAPQALKSVLHLGPVRVEVELRTVVQIVALEAVVHRLLLPLRCRQRER